MKYDQVEPDYTVDMFHNEQDYTVFADLVNPAEYEIFKDEDGIHDCLEVFSDPEFSLSFWNDMVESYEDPDKQMIEKATEILENIYWDRNFYNRGF